MQVTCIIYHISLRCTTLYNANNLPNTYYIAIIAKMYYQIKVFDLPSQRDKLFLDNVILPQQTHSSRIVEIKTGKEDLHSCDGIFTENTNAFALGIKTADCATICFYNKRMYGIIHAGWRGLVDGIVEKMCAHFAEPHVFVVPFMHTFEIQKDNCYRRIYNKFGTKFFEIVKNKYNTHVLFHFHDALASLLPKDAVFDPRDTYKTPMLASWCRNKSSTRNYTIIYEHSPQIGIRHLIQ